MYFRPFLSCLRILAIALLATMAAEPWAYGQSAQAPGPGEPDTTEEWARGVSPKARQKAIALRNQGREMAHEFQLTRAVKKYMEALKHWNHPVFHYDLCRILNALDRPLDAYDSVKQALRHGPEPLADDEATQTKRYQQMLALKAELEQRLVTVEITSPESNVDVSVDNHTVNPGARDTKVLLPGSHRMAAQKSGHRALIRTLDLPPGTNASFHLVGRQPFAPWKPWVTLGVGGALTLAGAGLYWHASSEHDALERMVQASCAPSCKDEDPITGDIEEDWQRVHLRNRIGLGSLIVGGTVLVTGAGLVLWNQQRDFVLVPNRDEQVSITPVASPELTGVAGTLRF